MFKNILVPTDGTQCAREATRAAVEFARHEHAKIIGFYALNPGEFRPRVHAPYLLGAFQDLQRDLTRTARHQAQEALNFIEHASRSAGVPCETHLELTCGSPYEAIVREAEKAHCDLIFMASDAQTGLTGWFGSSEATKVMAVTKIPVLLYRH